MSLAVAGTTLEQHPFVTRLLQYSDLDPADLKGLEAIIDGELLIRRRG